MLAQWNAVYVDDQWRLLDVFWASTCLVGRHSADWALLDSDGELVDSNDDNVQVTHIASAVLTVCGAQVYVGFVDTLKYLNRENLLFKC